MKIHTQQHPMRVGSQRGGTLLGLALGLLVGLGIAVAVAMYVSKVPIPFVDKLPQRTADQDAAETERNRNWNPNAPLSGKTPVPGPGTGGAGGGGTEAGGQSGAGQSDGVATLPSQPGGTPGPSPTGTQQPPRGTEPPRVELTGLFIQAGAYSRPEEAEQQRARLAMLGFSARISEREQGGRTVWRVRVGPYETREETQGPMDRLMASGIEVSLVRVERSATP